MESAGAKPIDFSKNPSLIHHGELFFDATHLNDDGAKILTDTVLKVLKEDGLY